MGGVRLERLAETAKQLEAAQELREARQILDIPESEDWPSKVMAVLRDLNRRRPLGDEPLPDLLRRLDAAREALKWPKPPGWAQRAYRIVAPLEELLADPEPERCEAKIRRAGWPGETSRAMAVVAMSWWLTAPAAQADHLLRLALVLSERANRLEGKP